MQTKLSNRFMGFYGICLLVVGIGFASGGRKITNCDPPGSVSCEYRPPSPIALLEIRANCCPHCVENTWSGEEPELQLQSASLEHQLISFTQVEVESERIVRQKCQQQTSQPLSFGKGWSSQSRQATEQRTSVANLSSNPISAKKSYSTAPLLPNFR